MKVPSALLGGAAFFLAGCATHSEIKPAKIDLSRYMGTWRVIACTDNPVEKKFVDATESYALADAKHINVTFKWREESFTAPFKTHQFKGTVQKDPSHAVWKMKLLPLFAATYIVVEIGPDYSWAAVAHPSKKFGWLLARDTTVSDETWAHVLNRFGSMGYDPTKFIKVPQPASR